uniref:Tensin-3-like n=1 Tax=Petromyzon marinus TaxID=7757 RepID=A0AAJ7T9I4_PETMA|nr:tensin-3-like [Petromyzon marinus]
MPSLSLRLPKLWGRKRRTAEIVCMSCVAQPESPKAAANRPNSAVSVASSTSYELDSKVEGGARGLEASPGHGLDLTYVADRIVATCVPAEASEGASQRGLQEMAHHLASKHGGNYLVINFSGPKEELTKLHPQVLEFCWPGLHAPQLDTLCRVCKAMESWLAAHPSHVVVLHCQGNRSSVGTVIAAYFHYSDVCTRSEHSLGRFPTKTLCGDRFSAAIQPSQRRYVYYFSGLLSRSISLNTCPLFLHQVVLHGLPRGGSGGRLFLRVYQGLQLMYTSSVYSVPANGTAQSLSVNVKPALMLKGDVLVKCYREAPASGPPPSCGREAILRLQLHTAAMRPCDTSLLLRKQDLDLACSDPRYPDDGKVQLIFSATPDRMAGAENLLKDGAVAVDHSATDPILRWDSYGHLHTSWDTFASAEKARPAGAEAKQPGRRAADGGGGAAAAAHTEHTLSVSSDSGRSTASMRTSDDARPPASPLGIQCQATTAYSFPSPLSPVPSWAPSPNDTHAGPTALSPGEQDQLRQLLHGFGCAGGSGLSASTTAHRHSSRAPAGDRHSDPHHQQHSPHRVHFGDTPSMMPVRETDILDDDVDDDEDDVNDEDDVVDIQDDDDIDEPPSTRAMEILERGALTFCPGANRRRHLGKGDLRLNLGSGDARPQENGIGSRSPYARAARATSPNVKYGQPTHAAAPCDVTRLAPGVTAIRSPSSDLYAMVQRRGASQRSLEPGSSGLQHQQQHHHEKRQQQQEVPRCVRFGADVPMVPAVPVRGDSSRQAVQGHRQVKAWSPPPPPLPPAEPNRTTSETVTLLGDTAKFTSLRAGDGRDTPPSPSELDQSLEALNLLIMDLDPTFTPVSSLHRVPSGHQPSLPGILGAGQCTGATDERRLLQLGSSSSSGGSSSSSEGTADNGGRRPAPSRPWELAQQPAAPGMEPFGPNNGVDVAQPDSSPEEQGSYVEMVPWTSDAFSARSASPTARYCAEEAKPLAPHSAPSTLTKASDITEQPGGISTQASVTSSYMSMVGYPTNTWARHGEQHEEGSLTQALPVGPSSALLVSSHRLPASGSNHGGAGRGTLPTYASAFPKSEKEGPSHLFPSTSSSSSGSRNESRVVPEGARSWHASVFGYPPEGAERSTATQGAGSFSLPASKHLNGHLPASPATFHGFSHAHHGTPGATGAGQSDARQERLGSETSLSFAAPPNGAPGGLHCNGGVGRKSGTSSRSSYKGAWFDSLPMHFSVDGEGGYTSYSHAKPEHTLARGFDGAPSDAYRGTRSTAADVRGPVLPSGAAQRPLAATAAATAAGGAVPRSARDGSLIAAPSLATSRASLPVGAAPVSWSLRRNKPAALPQPPPPPRASWEERQRLRGSASERRSPPHSELSSPGGTSTSSVTFVQHAPPATRGHAPPATRGHAPPATRGPAAPVHVAASGWPDGNNPGSDRIPHFTRSNISFVQDTSKFWYKPGITREQGFVAHKRPWPVGNLLSRAQSWR